MKLSKPSFAVGVLMRAVADAAAAPVRAEAEKRITDWVDKAKARYKERCGDSIPDEDAQTVAQCCFMLNCMAGTVGAYHQKHPKDWPDPMVAADADMESWGKEEGKRA